VKLLLYDEKQLKDEKTNDDKFLQMLEAMYGSNENHLAQKLLDYDFCSNQGTDTARLFKYFC
jgi:hypothetical protein